MLTIGDQFLAYELTAVIPGDLSGVDAKRPEDYFTTVSSAATGEDSLARRLLLAEGLHLRLPDRDRRLRPPGGGVRRPRHRRARRLDRLRVRPLRLAPRPRGPARPADPDGVGLKRELVSELGILNAEGVADRATFLIDPNNEIQFAMVTAGSVGRNVDEVLRVLDALQSDELCACNWKKGEATIDAGALMAGAA